MPEGGWSPAFEDYLKRTAAQSRAVQSAAVPSADAPSRRATAIPSDYDPSRRATASSSSEAARDRERARGTQQMQPSLAGMMNRSQTQQQLAHEAAEKRGRLEAKEDAASRRLGGKRGRESALDDLAGQRRKGEEQLTADEEHVANMNNPLYKRAAEAGKERDQQTAEIAQVLHLSSTAS